MAMPKLSGSGKPTKFSRPAIDLDKPIRKWQTVQVRDLQLEDVVPDLGLITDVMVSRTSWDDYYVTFTGAGGKVKTFGADDLIFAFTTAK